MPELEQVMQALKKADAAGNVEDAKVLAQVAKRLQQQQPQQQTEQPKQPQGARGMMPYVNKAIADALTFVPEGVAQGLSLIPGINIADKPREYIRKGFAAIGADLPEEGQPPKTMMEHIGRGVGEVTSFMIPGGLATKAVAKGTGLTGSIARNILTSIGKHPYMTTVSEITAGVGAGAGRRIAEHKTDSPAGQMAGEMVGGIVGGMAPAIAPTSLAIRYGKPILRKLTVPFTRAGQKYRAGQHVQDMAIDPKQAARVAAEPSIGGLPPAVQTGERRLIELYKNVAAMDPVKEAEAIEKTSRAIVKLEAEMRKMGYGSPELLADITKKRVAAIELGMDTRIANATAKAQAQLEKMPVARRYGAESAVVNKELRKVMMNEKVKEQALWHKVNKNTSVGFDNTRNKFKGIVSDLSVAQRTDIPMPLKSNPIIVNDKLEISNIREMQGLRSRLLEVSRRARKDGKWNKARIADEVADAILEDIGIVAQTATTPEAADLQAALAATRHFKTRFESGITGKILGYDKSGAPAIDPTLTLDISIGRSGRRGAVDIKKVVVTPEAQKATERYLARSYTDYALDNTGAINPIKSQRWIKSNEAILDQFPELRTQLLDAEGAQRLAQRTQEVMTARKAALRDPSVSVSARYLRSADLHAEISTIFKNPNGAEMTAELVRQARKDGTGQALQGLKYGFVEDLLDRANIGAYNEFGEKSLSGRTLLGLINGHEKTLSQAFTSDEIGRMRQIGRELVKAETFMKSRIGKPDLEMKDLASKTLSLFARIQGARIGGKMGKESAGGSLQMAQIFSGKAKDFVAWLTKDRAQEMIKDAVLSKDPALLRALLTPMEKPGAAQMKELNYRLNVWLAGAGMRVYEDITRESE